MCTVNVGSLKGRSREVVVMLSRRGGHMLSSVGGWGGVGNGVGIFIKSDCQGVL